MKIIIKTTATGTKIVRQAGDFIVGNTYLLTGGFHSGQLIRLEHISQYKQVMIDGVRHRHVNGTLVESGADVNSVLSYLQPVV